MCDVSASKSTIRHVSAVTPPALRVLAIDCILDSQRVAYTFERAFTNFR